MSAERPHRDNSGVLFVNHRRHTDKSPAYEGEATVAGVRYRMAAWEKQGKFDKFYSLSFSIPQKADATKPEGKEEGQ